MFRSNFIRTDEIVKVAAEIKPAKLKNFLISTGWQAVETGKPEVALFKKQILKEVFEALVPLSNHFADYKYRMADVIISIAGAENKAVADIAWVLKSCNPVMSLRIQNKIDEIKKIAQSVPESSYTKKTHAAQSTNSLAKIITDQKMGDDFLADLEMAIKKAQARYPI